MSPNPEDPQLSRVLESWRVNPPREPNFRAAVWSRLETARRTENWPTYLRAHGAAVATALAVAVVLGGWAGRGEARARVEAERATMANAYVQSLDARAMRMP